MHRVRACLNRAVKRAMARDLVKGTSSNWPKSRAGVPAVLRSRLRPSKSMMCSPKLQPTVCTTTWSFRCSRAGGPRNYGPCAGSMCTLKHEPMSCRRYHRTSRSGGRLASIVTPRRRGRVARSRFLAAASRRSGYSGRSSWQIDWRPGSAGRRQGSSSRPRSEPRWPPGTFGGTSAARSHWSPASIHPNGAPRELRHSFVSVLSDAGVPVEEISRLVSQGGYQPA